MIEVKTISYGAAIWDIIGEEQYLGGDSLNVASHLAKLSAESYFFSRLGTDGNGENAKKIISERTINTEFIQTDTIHPTGYAKVMLDDDGVPSYNFCKTASDEFIDIDEATIKKLTSLNFDYFAYSSYPQFGAKSADSLYKILDRCNFKHTFCDLNIRRNFKEKAMIEKSLKHADILKISDEECDIVSKELFGEVIAEKEIVFKIKKQFNINIVCVTKGGDGTTVYDKNNAYKDIPTEKIKVIDTVGAGDAFSAGFITFFDKTGDPFIAAKYGNLLGGYVASCNGAVPSYSVELLEKLNKVV